MVSVDALWPGGRGSFPGELAIFTVLQVSVFLFLFEGGCFSLCCTGQAGSSSRVMPGCLADFACNISSEL